MSLDLTVMIKGAGEMATGVAVRLFKSHFRVFLTEDPQPKAVRRAVSFSEAVYDGVMEVEGVTAVRVDGPAELEPTWRSGRIPLLVDPRMNVLKCVAPDVLVEATLCKRNTGIDMGMARVVIALGPGYQAGVDAHYVLETNRGHNLGAVITSGRAEPNTGVPGTIAGKSHERVLRAPADGIFEARRGLGDMVRAGQVVAVVDGREMISKTDGLLRGILRPGSLVEKGQKAGDVDPRCEPAYLHTISEKARAMGGSVLEAIMRSLNRAESTG